ncbi:hypothetical protein EJ06DRAFT_527329 [Trichodelitschia bisporula]|uniref:Uncharacterized protein n=1 Tax=Trichodelitschia bisporula TaxID=703511 RepID=A0A6G1I6Q6_9PEZI|nr:hypothetical protein EJ06DRAFT_527329 [Trichodelitschia bisporula]
MPSPAAGKTGNTPRTPTKLARKSQPTSVSGPCVSLRMRPPYSFGIGKAGKAGNGGDSRSR